MSALRYSDAEIALIRQLLVDGQTYREICVRLSALRGGASVSRNAVAGLIARTPALREATFAAGSEGPKGPVGLIRERKQAAPRPRPARQAEARAAPEGVPLTALGFGQCKWPVNDAEPGEPHLFCGARAARGPYCACHAERAFGGQQLGFVALPVSPRLAARGA